VTDIRDTQIGAEAWVSPAPNKPTVSRISGEAWVSRASIPTEINCIQMSVEAWISSRSAARPTFQIIKV